MMTIEVDDAAVLELPGIVATRTSLTVSASANDQQLIRAFAKLATMESAVSWWFGDLGIAMQERKRRFLTIEAANMRGRAAECADDTDGIKAKRQLLERADKIENSGVVQYTSELCALHNVSEGYLRNCVMRARFFAPSHRSDALKPKHHEIAMLAAGGAKGSLETAEKWLADAEARDLTPSELRKEVLLASAEHSQPDHAPEPLSYEALIAADKWAVEFKSKWRAMPNAQLVAILTMAQGLRELFAEMDARLAIGVGTSTSGQFFGFGGAETKTA